jgi:hypothetical protein
MEKEYAVWIKPLEYNYFELWETGFKTKKEAREYVYNARKNGDIERGERVIIVDLSQWH